MCLSILLARISREWNTSIIHRHWFIEFWLITQVCAFAQVSFQSVYYDTYKLSYHLQMAKMMKIPYVKFVGQTLMFFVFLAVVMAMSTTEEPHQGSVMTYHNVRYVCWRHMSHHITNLSPCMINDGHNVLVFNHQLLEGQPVIVMRFCRRVQNVP